MTSLVSPSEVIARVPAAAKLDPSGSPWTNLQLIIDANETLLRSRDQGSYGTNPITITVQTGRGDVYLLPYRFTAISQIKEHFFFADPISDITLSTDDWRLAPGGTAIQRLADGTHQTGGYFADELIITGTIQDLTAVRKNILIQLCAADINTTASTGLRRQRLGDYEEEKSSAATNGPTAQKEEILSQLWLSSLPVFS